MRRVAQEPVLSAITALVVAGVAVLAAFGVDFTAEQTSAIAGFVGVAYAVALVVRSKVRPWRSRAATLESARRR